MAFDEESHVSLLDNKRELSDGLASEEDDEIGEFEQVVPHYKAWWRRLHPGLVHVGFLFLYTTIFVAALTYTSSRACPLTQPECSGGGGRASLLDPALRHIVRTVPYNFEGRSAFRGPSVAEVQEQWLALLNRPHSMHVSPSQMASANLSSLRLSDGSGDFLVQPVPYHMLHCLYTLYRYLHPEFYGEDPSGQFWIVEHSEHCIDNLRLYVMCHASTGVSTFKWLENRKIPWATLSADETCVDWDYYDGWVRDRSIAMDEILSGHSADGKPMLTHPKLGPVTAEDNRNAGHTHLTAPYKLPAGVAPEFENTH